jgi:hypothetical protein
LNGELKVRQRVCICHNYHLWSGGGDLEIKLKKMGTERIVERLRERRRRWIGLRWGAQELITFPRGEKPTGGKSAEFLKIFLSHGWTRIVTDKSTGRNGWLGLVSVAKMPGELLVRGLKCVNSHL